jgi:hypothetical protein
MDPDSDGEDEGAEDDVDPRVHPPRRVGHDATVSQNFRVGNKQVASYVQEMIHDNRREEMRVLLLRYGEDPSEGCGPPSPSPLSSPPFLAASPSAPHFLSPPSPPSHHLAVHQLETRYLSLFPEDPDADPALVTDMSTQDVGDRLIKLVFLSSGLRQVVEDSILGTNTKLDRKGLLEDDNLVDMGDDNTMRPAVSRRTALKPNARGRGKLINKGDSSPASYMAPLSFLVPCPLLLCPSVGSPLF